VLTERRVRLESGFEVELGLVPPTWAEADPVDPGTSTVVRGGCRILRGAVPQPARRVGDLHAGERRHG